MGVHFREPFLSRARLAACIIVIQDAPLGNGPLVTVESRLSVCPLALLMTYRKYTILAQKVFEI